MIDITPLEFALPQLPREPFFIRDQNGDQDGPFDPKNFAVDDSNVAVYQTDSSRALFLRCVAQEGNNITSLDGEGISWQYQLIPLSQSSGLSENS